jgi:hypothetical protein
MPARRPARAVALAQGMAGFFLQGIRPDLRRTIAGALLDPPESCSALRSASFAISRRT